MVQRVPVRIALDPKQLVANPLRIGLSMDAVVDVANKDGKMLADTPRAAALSQTQVYSALDHGAAAEVERVIAANMGRAPASASTPAAPATSTGHAPAPAHGAPIAASGPGAKIALQQAPRG